MKEIKKNKTNKKSKKYKMSKKTWIILTVVVLIVITIATCSIIYLNSEKYQKNKMEKLVSKWAEEYYLEELVNIAPEYVKAKANEGENITINLNALESVDKDISEIKNKKNNDTCDDINSYVIIKVEKNAKDITKDYKIEKVILDCFD